MTGVFCVLTLGGILLAAFCGRIDAVSAALLADSSRAVQLTISLLGSFCFWGGVMRVAEESRLTSALSRALTPVTGKLFKGVNPDGAAMNAISMNLIANFLGLGNAATPLGITAMRELEREERAVGSASDNMALFCVLNTASLQLLPTTTAMLRLNAGSRAPLEILPCVWLASAASVTVGVCACKLFSFLGRKRGNA